MALKRDDANENDHTQQVLINDVTWRRCFKQPLNKRLDGRTDGHRRRQRAKHQINLVSRVVAIYLKTNIPLAAN